MSAHSYVSDSYTDGPRGDAMSRWERWPTPAQRTAVRHALTRLFDDLAPVGAPPRGAARPRTAVQRHRSPRGCILQAHDGAVSVSWFAAADTESAFGELVVTTWSGVVSQPGATHQERDGAVAMQVQSLRPVEVAPQDWRWRGTDDTDDTVYDAEGLAGRCRALLARVAGPEPAAP